MRLEKKEVVAIIEYLREVGVAPYYIQGEYLHDLVENGDITDEQLEILSADEDLKERVNAIYVPDERVDLPEEIIAAIKSAKEYNIFIDDFCIDWSVGINDYDFDVVVMDWLEYSYSKERYDKILQIYIYATQNWDTL